MQPRSAYLAILETEGGTPVGNILDMTVMVDIPKELGFKLPGPYSGLTWESTHTKVVGIHRPGTGAFLQT